MVERLTQQTEALRESVEQLATSVEHLAGSQRRIKRVIAATVAGLVLDLALTVVAAFLFNTQRTQGNRLEALHTRTSNEVLCPLYAVLLSFEPQARANPNLSPEDQARRQHAYAVIHEGYRVLDCR